MKKIILEIALAKVKHCHGRLFCGCFTPCEIMALIEDGARPNHPEHWEYEEKYIKDKIKKGISYQTWFYFYKEGLVKE